jgi:hypothetical protein
MNVPDHVRSDHVVDIDVHEKQNRVVGSQKEALNERTNPADL